MPEATNFMPSRTITWARTVVVVVPSPAASGVLDATFHHLRAHVLEFVLELDLLGHRNAVLGDGRGAERALEHDVADRRTRHCRPR